MGLRAALRLIDTPGDTLGRYARRPPSLWDDGANTRLRRQLCAYVLERDGYACHWCGGYATTVDHVIARAQGGTDALTNLVAACTPCNSARGAALVNNRPEPSRRW